MILQGLQVLWYRSSEMKKCRNCSKRKRLVNFQRDNRCPTGHTNLCKNCASVAANAWHHRNREHHNRKMRTWWKKNKAAHPARHLWVLAKRREAANGRAFDITPGDIHIPEYCPVFGSKLEFGNKTYSPNAASLDAIIPELGHVRGNIAVISHRANTIKNDASVEELLKVAKWLRRVTRRKAHHPHLG